MTDSGDGYGTVTDSDGFEVTDSYGCGEVTDNDGWSSVILEFSA